MDNQRRIELINYYCNITKQFVEMSNPEMEKDDEESYAAITEAKYNGLKIAKLAYELLGEECPGVITDILNGGN